MKQRLQGEAIHKNFHVLFDMSTCPTFFITGWFSLESTTMSFAANSWFLALDSSSALVLLTGLLSEQLDVLTASWVGFTQHKSSRSTQITPCLQYTEKGRNEKLRSDMFEEFFVGENCAKLWGIFQKLQWMMILYLKAPAITTKPVSFTFFCGTIWCLDLKKWLLWVSTKNRSKGNVFFPVWAWWSISYQSWFACIHKMLTVTYWEIYLYIFIDIFIYKWYYVHNTCAYEYFNILYIIYIYINPPDSPPSFKIKPIQVEIVHVNSFPSHDLFPEAAVPRAVKVGLVVNTNMFF